MNLNCESTQQPCDLIIDLLNITEGDTINIGAPCTLTLLHKNETQLIFEVSDLLYDEPSDE